MRYPAEETAEKHQRILSEASRLFREKGLGAVSVGELMQAADLTHGAFYNHFASKQALVADCIASVSEHALARIHARERTTDGKLEFINEYLSQWARDNPGSACLMSSLGPEVAREPTARPAMTRYIHSFIGKLVSHFPWPKQKDARRDAIRMTSSMVGALVLARAVDDEELSQEILKAVIDQAAGAKK